METNNAVRQFVFSARVVPGTPWGQVWMQGTSEESARERMVQVHGFEVEPGTTGRDCGWVPRNRPDGSPW